MEGAILHEIRGAKNSIMRRVLQFSVSGCNLHYVHSLFHSRYLLVTQCSSGCCMTTQISAEETATYMVHKTWPRHVSFSSGILWMCRLWGASPHCRFHSNLSLREGEGVVPLDWKTKMKKMKQQLKSFLQKQWLLTINDAIEYTEVNSKYYSFSTYSFINSIILSAVLSFTSKASSPSLLIDNKTINCWAT